MVQKFLNKLLHISTLFSKCNFHRHNIMSEKLNLYLHTAKLFQVITFRYLGFLPFLFICFKIFCCIA